MLGNKIDHPDAVSEEQLRSELGLYQTTGKGRVPLVNKLAASFPRLGRLAGNVEIEIENRLTRWQEGIRPIEVFMCSIILRQGYGEGIRWLSQYV